MNARSALLAGLLLASVALAQQPPPDNKDKDGMSRIPYSGGGIRGVREIVADGTLVTPSEAREYQGEAGYLEPLPLRPRSVLPGIDVLRPQPATDLKVKSPFALAVQFRGLDSPIVPTSFRVLYGAERVDITQRITRNTRVDAGGFTLENAQLPPGRHKLVLEVQDEKQRVAQRELRLQVE